MAYASAQFDATDEAGNLLTDVTVEIRRETGGLQAVFADRDGTILLGSRFISDSGHVEFYAPGNAYRIRLSKAGYQRELRYYAVGLASESDMVIRNFRGEWNAEDTYRTFEMVTHDGLGFFVSTMEENTGHQPDAATPASTVEWTFWAQEAPTGWKSLAQMVVTGGTENDIAAMVAGGIDPAAVVMYVMKPALTNTGPVTINGTALLAFDGNPLEAGFLPAGAPVLIERDDAGDYRLAMDHRFQALSAYAADKAAEAKAWAELSQQVALPAGIITAEKISDDPAQQVAIRAKIGAIATSDVVPLLDELELVDAQLALRLADVSNQALFVGPTGNRVADSFDTLTYVDVAGATNLDISTVGVLKPSITVASGQTAAHTNYAQNGNTISVSVPENSGFPVWLAVDKNGGTQWISTTMGPVAVTYQFSSARKIASYKLSSVGTVQTTAPNTWIFEGSNDGSSWITIDNRSGQTWASGEAKTFTVTTPGTYTYYRLNISANNGGGDTRLLELEYFSGDVANNLTVRSAVFTAATPPAKMKALLRVKEVDTAIAGTDYTLECSRDAGTTWAIMPLSEMFATSGLLYVETAEVDVSGQPSGTSPRWRFKTLNNKNVELHDVYFYWS